MRKRVAISLTSFAEYDEEPMSILRAEDQDIVLNPHGRRVSAEEVIELAKDANGLIAGTEDLSANTLQQLKKLKVISRCGTGMENIDLEAARRLGIAVYNTPDGPTKAVVELVIGLIINLLRHISKADRAIRNGIWEKKMGSLLEGKTVGIIGFGQIGQSVARLIQTLNAHVVYYDPEVDSSTAARLDLDDLLKNADIVTLHVPLTNQTRHMIAKKELGLLKRDALLLNCSRGGVVVEEDLYKVLQNQKIAGAAVDVFEQEPYSGPLKDLDNVILTPHIGSYAKEARVAMEIKAAHNLILGLQQYKGDK